MTGDEHGAGRREQAAKIDLDLALREAVRDRAEAREPIASRRPAGADGLRRRIVLGLAGCGTLAAGGLAGWSARDVVGGPRPTEGRAWDRLARDALAAHRTYAADIAHPVEVRADQERHLTQWLSGRLGAPLLVPDLSDAFGLRLVGGRLLPAGETLAALLMYADPADGRLTLYVRAGGSGQAEMNFMRLGELSCFAWIGDGAGYAVAAAMDRERLQKIAKAVSQEHDLAAARRRRAL